MTDKNEIISATQKWVKQLVVKYNICPFARREVERGSIRYCQAEEPQREFVLQTLLDECHRLDADQEIETTLFILPSGYEGFYDFLDLLDMANDLLELEGYEGVYQLANFHPDYCFADEVQNAPSNYTNRSPYPTLHIIRESSMEFAIANHPDVDSIPQRNIEFTNKKGNAFFADLLAGCLKHE
ncbi:MAG: hypothetical protein ACJAZP_000817 [Psychromonas sp.]|jgi:hypothetical protein|uniref:DUF1415 domain-containing protein n=1 Tax=Psychromonas sp. TaxID=1884585 RepID=UPI0039E45784